MSPALPVVPGAPVLHKPAGGLPGRTLAGAPGSGAGMGTGPTVPGIAGPEGFAGELTQALQAAPPGPTPGGRGPAAPSPAAAGTVPAEATIPLADAAAPGTAAAGSATGPAVRSAGPGRKPAAEPVGAAPGQAEAMVEPQVEVQPRVPGPPETAPRAGVIPDAGGPESGPRVPVGVVESGDAPAAKVAAKTEAPQAGQGQQQAVGPQPVGQQPVGPQLGEARTDEPDQGTGGGTAAETGQSTPGAEPLVPASLSGRAGAIPAPNSLAVPGRAGRVGGSGAAVAGPGQAAAAVAGPVHRRDPDGAPAAVPASAQSHAAAPVSSPVSPSVPPSVPLQVPVPPAVPNATGSAPAVPMTGGGGAAVPVSVPARLAAAGPVAQLGAAFVALPQAGRPGEAQTLVIRLDPLELGRVQIKVERGADGLARVDLAAERPDTLMLLMQDRPRLDQALTTAGVPAEGRTLQFSLAAPQPAGGLDAGGGAGGGTGGHSGQRTGGQAQDSPAFGRGAGGDGGWDEGPRRDRRAAVAWARAGVDITA